MMSSEFSYEEQSRHEANAQLGEATRDAVNLLCTNIIPICFDRIKTKLAEDAQELELYEISGMPADTHTEVFVSPNGRDAPMRDKGPQETLTLLLASDHTPDAIRIYMPITREGYVYPEPIYDDIDMPEELYFEYLPDTASDEKYRFIMQKDPFDLKDRYRIFRYESAADGGEERVYDSLNDIELLANVGAAGRWNTQPIPEDARHLVRLVYLLAQLDETVQKEITSPYSNPEQ